MPTRPPHRYAFATYQRMTVLLVLALMAAFAMYVVSERAIDDANDNRFQTHNLAHELRLSSDDLTRMVRSYIATGEPRYKQYYQDILDIRDGNKPRPLHYDHVYWDLVISQKIQPQPESGPPVALLSMMREAGFVEEEFALLALAKSRSDALTRIELQAMALVDGKATPQQRAQATHLLEDDTYNAAKAGIMLPLNQVFSMAEQRTLDAVEAAKQRALMLRGIVVLLGLGVLWSIWRTVQAQRAVLGSTVEGVYAQIAMLGKGQLDALPDVPPAMQDSVLGRLVDTQQLLLGNEQRRAQLDARLRRLTHLYAALTECTLTLTRATTDEELFSQTCKAAVAHGGMRMAWIGLVDWDHHRVQSCTAYGDGIAYLEGLHISIDPDKSEGRGPTGTTVRNDQPEWCQDYQADPRTVAWHSLGRQYGWAASASLPVHRNGTVIATFNVYAGEVGAFDDDIQGLLLRMVANIDYGLHALDQNAARSQAELETRESQTRLALAYRGSQDALWDWNLKNDVLHYSPRWWEMIGYAPDTFPSDANLWRKVTHPDDVRRVTQLLRDFLRSDGESFEAECRLLHSDGHIVPVLVRGFVTRDASGRAIRVSGTNMDITERVQALQMNTLRSDMLERLSSDLPLVPLLEEFARKMEEALPGTQCAIVLQDQTPAIEAPAQPAHHVLQEPIHSGTNTLLGHLQITRPTPEPARAHAMALLQMAAHITGIAIERKRAEMQLHLSSAVFEQGSEIIMITDAKARMVRVNKAFTLITGYSEEEALGRNPSMLSSGRQDSTFYQAMWQSLMAQGRWQGEVWNRRKDGSVYPEWLSISPVHDAAGALTHFVAIGADITQRKQDEERIRMLADFDPLTSLPNRRLLQDRVSTALSHALRQNEPLALMFLDLDRFKNVNDSLGHQMGDELLIQVARRLAGVLRDQDTVCRLGGDEFVMLCPATDATGAAHLAERLLLAIAQRHLILGQEISITSSIGIAMYPADGDSFEVLSMRADTAMYRAKQSGRNAFCFFTHEMQQLSARTLQLENGLRRALELNQLSLVYQPQIDIQTGGVVGVEALVRWNHPTLGTVSPAEFIPVAEDSGLILSIGEWVLRTATRQLQTWLAAGLPLQQVAVNLSAVQFKNTKLPHMVTQILDECGLPARCLELELTEGVAMNDAQGAIEIMHNLGQRGVRMSIDDFGTGYSSLSYLKRFHVYKLKIDQSFVRDITEDPEDRGIVVAIIQLAKSLGFLTIAEGVETEGQLAFLREQGCDEVQGYFYSRPLTPDALEAFVVQTIGTNSQ